MLLKLAWRNIWRNKVRTTITFIGVILAVVLSTLTSSMKEGMYANWIKTLVSDFGGYAQLHTTDFVDAQVLDNSLELTDSLENYLKANNDLKAYVPRISHGALVYKDTIPAITSKRSIIFGLDPDKEKEFIGLNDRVVEGEYLSPGDQAVLMGSGLAKRLKVGIGDSIIMSSVGYQDMSAHGLYLVKGIVKFGSPELSNNLTILPLDVAQYVFNMERRCTEVILQLQNNDEAESIAENISIELGDEFTSRDWKELNADLLKMIQTDRVEGYVFMFILYMVIGFGLFGTMLMMLSERQHEFGVLVSIGMKRLKLAVIVWMELIAISFLGTLLGMLVSYPICSYFYHNPVRFGGEQASMMEDYGIEPVLQFSTETWVFGQQGMIIFVISSMIAIYPFFKLMRLNAQNAMKS